MRRIAIIQHHPAEEPGRLLDWACQRGHRIQLYCAWEQALPCCDAFDALILLGGPFHLHQAPAWLADELACLHQFVENKRPIFGICLGSQLLTMSLGGSVQDSPSPEQGWCVVHFADGTALNCLQWHQQQSVPAPGVEILAHSSACAVQMYRHDRFIGVQFHPEWDPATVTMINKAFADSPLSECVNVEYDIAITSWFYHTLDQWLAG